MALSTEEEILQLEASMKPQHIMFTICFMECFEAKKACIDAKYKSKHPGVRGHQLLVRPDISRLLSLKMKSKEDGVKLDTSSTVGLIRDAMHLDPADYLDAKGNYKLIQDLPIHARKAIQSMSITERKVNGETVDVTHSYQFIAKTRMIELLATIQKLKKDEAEEIGDNFASKLAKAAERLSTAAKTQDIQDESGQAAQPTADNITELRQTG